MSVLSKVQQILVENLGVETEEITVDAHIRDDLGADSLDVVEIVMAIEQEFDIEVSDEEAEKIETVQDTIKFIEEKTK